MQNLTFALALFLLLTLLAGMWRIFRGPTDIDRMLATQLFGTTAVAILLLLAESSGNASFRDIALVFALLAAITAVAFVRKNDMGQEQDEQGHEHAD